MGVRELTGRKRKRKIRLWEDALCADERNILQSSIFEARRGNERIESLAGHAAVWLHESINFVTGGLRGPKKTTQTPYSPSDMSIRCPWQRGRNALFSPLGGGFKLASK